jgi:hypothetical protein
MGGVKGLRMAQTFAAKERWLNVVQIALCRLVSRPLLGITLRGQSGALRLGALLLRLCRPSGYGFRLRRTLRKCSDGM